MEMRQELERQLKRLKMPGLWHALEIRLAEAREGKLGHLEFLALLIQDELCSREDSMFTKRLKAAGFGVEKSFADFDYRFNDSPPAVSVSLVGRMLLVFQRAHPGGAPSRTAHPLVAGLPGPPLRALSSPAGRHDRPGSLA